MSVNNGRDYLYLVWKADSNRRQYIVGQLSKNGKYEFKYSDEVTLALKEGFLPLVPFPNIEQTYYSEELFPVFTSRLPDRKRKDIYAILEKYGLKEYDAYQLLKCSGARLPIDKIQFIDPIFDTETEIKRKFYVAGSRHYLKCNGKECNNSVDVTRGEQITLEKEPNNQTDSKVVKVLNSRNELLGYIPRYYSEAITRAINEKRKILCFVSAVNSNNCCDECIELSITIS